MVLRQSFRNSSIHTKKSLASLVIAVLVLDASELFCFLGKVSEVALTEEEQLNDLLLLIKLLTNLLSKDILDFGTGQ